MRVDLHHGDCLDILPIIKAGSVDMVLCDLPYGTTACKWDSVIPFEPLWHEYRRVCKPSAAIVLTSAQPFTSALIASNMRDFKYCWVWDKRVASNSQLAKFQPLKIHEDICVFSAQTHMYLPQGVVACSIDKSNKGRDGGVGHVGSAAVRDTFVQTQTGYPKSIIHFTPHNKGKQHPTQKPVALFEYLIRTYTNEGDTVLDNTMGSGTTGVACRNTGRNFIGIERDVGYFEVAQQRIHGAANDNAPAANTPAGSENQRDLFANAA